MPAFFWLFLFSFGLVNSLFALSLEDTLSLSMESSRELASSRQAWVSARENVYSSSGSDDFSLTFSASGSLSRTDIGVVLKALIALKQDYIVKKYL